MADQDPSAKLDYGWDWSVATPGRSAWLIDGDTLASSTWTITPLNGAPATLVATDETSDTTSTTVWLSGGTVNCQYQVTNHVVSTAGREDDRSFVLRVKDT